MRSTNMCAWGAVFHRCGHRLQLAAQQRRNNRRRPVMRNKIALVAGTELVVFGEDPKKSDKGERIGSWRSHV
jgi:hypothetical protein